MPDARVPPEAVTAAATFLHAANCDCCSPPLESDFYLAGELLAAVAPFIVAAERERIAGLLRAAESPEDIWAIERALTGGDGSGA